jgi:hypothetical protein
MRESGGVEDLSDWNGQGGEKDEGSKQDQANTLIIAKMRGKVEDQNIEESKVMRSKTYCKFQFLMII